ncbi:hypothetical protein CBR_g21995 [Chara braunii]|uniref:Flavin-containing monooxygenase n=1 Tax=Chara braunii TaxID=69332 RepID=A0A388L1R7_CHABU|nr:hypothetical protein CBR_g21995 [Chara braunii]|eukprot:GBG76247.1 hypothetical protein CBR_g21995 [Chara braunii]
MEGSSCGRRRRCAVAVVGAGAAGLVSARELKREGHSVTVFEQQDRFGGLWVYDDRTNLAAGWRRGSKVDGFDAWAAEEAASISPPRVHNGIYKSLRTVIPRETMSYTDFPFLPKPGRDGRRFCGHVAVAEYLRDFADEFQLTDHIRLNTRVVRIEQAERQPQQQQPQQQQEEEEGGRRSACVRSWCERADACSRDRDGPCASLNAGENERGDETERMDDQRSHRDPDVTWTLSSDQESLGCASERMGESRPRPCARSYRDMPRGWRVTSRRVVRRRRRRTRGHDVLENEKKENKDEVEEEEEEEEEEEREEQEEVFDAVVVCNGHHWAPRMADVPGLDTWHGIQLHSHDYRTPDTFGNAVVLVIGGGLSGEDISKEVASVAAEVYLSARSLDSLAIAKGPRPIAGRANLYLRPEVERVTPDGHVAFADKSEVKKVDVIIHCTGYRYSFPFLEAGGLVHVEDNRVGPLFEHVFPPKLAPWLSFVGLPIKVVVFPVSEIQAVWVAQALSGKVEIPSAEEMMDEVGRFYADLDKRGVPKRYTHFVGYQQDGYVEAIRARCRDPPVFERWRTAMFKAVSANRRVHFADFRDTWTDYDLEEQGRISQLRVAAERKAREG